MENNSSQPTEAPKPTNDRWHHYRPWGFGLGLALLVLLVAAVIFGGLATHRRVTVGSQRAAYFGAGMMAGRAVGGEQFGQMKQMRFNRPVVGTVSKVTGNTLTIHTSSQDYTITVQGSTAIYKAGTIAKQADITTGLTIIVHGAPDSSGTIAATVITIV